MSVDNKCEVCGKEGDALNTAEFTQDGVDKVVKHCPTCNPIKGSGKIYINSISFGSKR